MIAAGGRDGGGRGGSFDGVMCYETYASAKGVLVEISNSIHRAFIA